MRDILDSYLAKERLRCFDWTSMANGDCHLFAAGWVEQIGWPDAGADWRGQYTSKHEARSLLDKRGGGVAVWIGVLGPPRMGSQPRRGDVGLLEIDGWHLGMICTGRMWVYRAEKRGIRFLRAEPEITWDLRFNHAASFGRAGAYAIPDGRPDLAI